MDTTKEKDLDTARLAELLESLKNYPTENTGAVTGAIGSQDTDFYNYSSDTITLDSQWNISSLTSANLAPSITIGGTGGYNYSNTAIGSAGTFTIGSTGWNNSSQNGVLQIQGDDADIKINGKSLNATLAALEQRLNILVPNPKMEAEWDELHELGERYRELEQKIKEKSTMWDKLKSMPKPQIE